MTKPLTDEQHRALTAGSPQSADVDTLHREVERLKEENARLEQIARDAVIRFATAQQIAEISERKAKALDTLRNILTTDTEEGYRDVILSARPSPFCVSFETEFSRATRICECETLELALESAIAQEGKK